MDAYRIETIEDIDALRPLLMDERIYCTNLIKDNDWWDVALNNGERFLVDTTFKSDIDTHLKFKDSPYQNKLIFGKNQIERIVCVEPIGDQLMIFREMPDHSIVHNSIPNKLWITASKPYTPDFKKLKGNQHYKWMKTFTAEEYKQNRRYYFKYDSYSIGNAKEASLIYTGATYFKGMNPKDISVLATDIETTGIILNKDSRVLCIANTYRFKDKITRKLFCYDDYASDKEMFEAWAAWVRHLNPSIIIGHNIFMFDLPYIQYCAERCEAKLDLGRDSSELWFDTFDSKFRKDGSQFYDYRKAHIFGREIIDTMFLSIRYDQAERKYESYALKQIIKQEGLEKKDRVFYDASQIKDNYKIKEEWKKIKAYATDDGDDAISIFDLAIPAFFYLSQIIPKSFQEIISTAPGSQLNSVLVRAYLSEGFSLPRATEVGEYQGGISLGHPGIYKNAVKLDCASEYPSIIRQYQLHDRVKDPEGYFYKIVEHLTTERLKNKKLFKETKEQYYKDLSESQKVICNSAYGLCATTGLLFNAPPIAKFITEQGRDVVKKLIVWASGSAYEVEKPVEEETEEADA